MNDNLEVLVEAQELILQAVSLLRKHSPEREVYGIAQDLLAIVGTENVHYHGTTLEERIQTIEDALRD